MRVLSREYLLLVAGATLLTWGLLTSSAEAFKTYPTCNVFEKRPDRDSVCSQGSGWGAVFIDKKQAGRRYRVCVKAPGGRSKCYSKRTRQVGKPSVLRGYRLGINNGQLGKWKFVWRVPGRGVVDKDRMLLRSEGV